MATAHALASKRRSLAAGGGNSSGVRWAPVARLDYWYGILVFSISGLIWTSFWISRCIVTSRESRWWHAQERQSPMQNITCCLIYSQSSGIGAINWSTSDFPGALGLLCHYMWTEALSTEALRCSFGVLRTALSTHVLRPCNSPFLERQIIMHDGIVRPITWVEVRSIEI
jgi:hypothetical protein